MTLAQDPAPSRHVRTATADELEAHYVGIERGLRVQTNSVYEHLVVPNGNGGTPAHRWFRLKEAFSLDLIPQFLADLKLDDQDELRILDPFAGSGTTAVATADDMARARVRSAYVLGYECNPFLHLVASAKLRALQSPTRSFLSLAKRVAASAARRVVDPAPVPDLAAFKNVDYFRPDDLDQLLRLRAAIDEASRAGALPLDVDLARVCLGATVEPVCASQGRPRVAVRPRETASSACRRVLASRRAGRRRSRAASDPSERPRAAWCPRFQRVGRLASISQNRISNDLVTAIERCKTRGVYVALSIDGTKKSGRHVTELPLPADLFERELFIDCGRSMLKRFQMGGNTLEAEGVTDRLLLTY